MHNNFQMQLIDSYRAQYPENYKDYKTPAERAHLEAKQRTLLKKRGMLVPLV